MLILLPLYFLPLERMNSVTIFANAFKKGIADSDLLRTLYVTVGILPLCLLSDKSLQPEVRTRSNKSMTLHSIAPVSGVKFMHEFLCINERLIAVFSRSSNVVLCLVTSIGVGLSIWL